jgi:CubicO group peptidase (beta-lactamase class C family)
MASLEDGTPSSPDTIFEAASVSKQFTASAVVLLARQGKLSLDDDVRTYLPELPVYARPISLRHMLGHTSGLRDWEAVEEVAGWPRGTRTYSQASVLEVMRRQRALNFLPGTTWSYSNSNYNLAAIVVERVSGMSFPEFTRQNLFAPLGMTHTSWRDDFTRIVPGRATAYAMGKDHAWHRDTPIENAIGSGGLLTTVADLLRWNENLSHPQQVGDAAFVATLEREGVREGGAPTGYGLGLFVSTEGGRRSVGHGGAMGGYRSYLERLPDEGLSIAILCNAGTAKPQSLGDAIAELLTPPAPEHAPPSAPAPAGAEPPSPLAAAAAGLAGLYRSERTGGPVAITAEGTSLHIEATTTDLAGLRGAFQAVTATTFKMPRGSSLEVVAPPKTAGGAPPTLRLALANGDALISRVTPWKPDVHALEAFEGEYASDEADARLSACVRDGKLVLLQGPGGAVALAPSYQDVFTALGPGWLVSFRRAGGRVTGLDVGSGRMWRLPFTRTGSHACTDRGGANDARKKHG